MTKPKILPAKLHLFLPGVFWFGNQLVIVLGYYVLLLHLSDNFWAWDRAYSTPIDPPPAPYLQVSDDTMGAAVTAVGVWRFPALIPPCELNSSLQSLEGERQPGDNLTVWLTSSRRIRETWTLFPPGILLSTWNLFCFKKENSLVPVYRGEWMCELRLLVL